MINISHLTRRYGRHAAVDDVSFSCKKNEIIGLLGHNGAGKSTLMRMLAGYLEPTSGDINYFFPESESTQANIGYLPEHCPLNDELAVQDYLFWRASMYGLHDAVAARAVADAMQAAAITQRAHDLIGKLSRGYRQRVGVAQAILHRPRLVILDEPTNGLDPQQILQMRALLQNLSRDAIVVVSTHIMQEVQAVCDRVLIMRRGRLSNDIDLKRENPDCLTVTFAASSEECEKLIAATSLVKTWEPLNTLEGHSSYRLEPSTPDVEAFAESMVYSATAAGIALIGLQIGCDAMESIMHQLDEGLSDA